MYCSNCANEIVEGQSFCTKCGSATTSLPAVQQEEKVQCPKCGSTQISANKKGFSLMKAAGGALLTGGIGLVAGAHGAGRIKLTCLKCGHGFKPGDKPIPKAPSFNEMTPAEQKKSCITLIIIIAIVVALFAYFRG